MHLIPLHRRSKQLPTTPRHESWPKHQMAVNGLMNEAAILLDVFNGVSLALGPDVKLNNIDAINDRVALHVPRSKWQSILSESCRDLQRCLTNFKPKSHVKSALLITRQ